MNSTVEPTPLYISAALDRIGTGIERKKRHARQKRTRVVAGGMVALSLVAIGAAVAWPEAEGSPYIVCMEKPSLQDSLSLTGIGVDMRDPVGFCLDEADFSTATSDGPEALNAPRNTWAGVPRDDLAACKLAAGVAGVFPENSSGDVCASLGLTQWTADDAVVAAQIRERENVKSQESGYGPKLVTITPSQLVPENSPGSHPGFQLEQKR